MALQVKRVYEKPLQSDGMRILIDRLWPRGIKKEDAKVDQWAKELAPSRELFAWFHEDKETRFKEFKKRYRKELATKKAEARTLLGTRKRITLVTSVKDIEHSHVPTLVAFLERARG